MTTSDIKEKGEKDEKKKPSTKLGKFIYKLKNGNPATKALLVFLAAPKGLVFFSPLLFKKYMPPWMLGMMSGFSMQSIALSAMKIGLSIAMYKYYKMW